MKWSLVLAAFVGGGGIVKLSLNPKAETTLASYATPLEGRMASQRLNAVLALQRIDGVVIAPGQTFSFNKAVGSWSRDRGYVKAPVSYNGTLIRSYGGGVCQASTTLYNVALIAGLTIIERNRHHFAPHYVPPGRDAAVAYESIDLRFRNDFSFPIKIRTEADGRTARISLVANARPIPRCNVIEVVNATRAPDTYLLRTGKMSYRVRNSGRIGFEVDVYRFRNGVKELVSSDNYPVMHKIVETK